MRADVTYEDWQVIPSTSVDTSVRWLVLSCIVCFGLSAYYVAACICHDQHVMLINAAMRLEVALNLQQSNAYYAADGGDLKQSSASRSHLVTHTHNTVAVHAEVMKTTTSSRMESPLGAAHYLRPTIQPTMTYRHSYFPCGISLRCLSNR